MRKILRTIKVLLLECISYIETKIRFCFSEEYRLLKKSNEKKRIFLDLPTHENLGDHAIAVSEYKFIKEKYPDEYLFRFSFEECRFCLKSLEKYILPKDILYLPGGGFIGSLWKRENNVVLKVLSAFSTNNIIIFPQTVYFYDNEKEEIERFKKITDANKNLTICVRDDASYKFLTENVNCDILLMPDIVLTYHKNQNQQKKNGKVLLCFRVDKERVFDSDELIRYLDSHHITYEYGSTIAKNKIKMQDAASAVEDIINYFGSYSLVICDRLHAMLFSYLGFTPCVAFDNLSKKVSGVHKWINSAQGCYCVEDGVFQFDQISELMNTKVEQVDLSDAFEALNQRI